jgi:hypothetical protein
LNQVLQGFAGEALHHDEKMAVVLADLVNGADVGVVQRRRSAGLAAETFESLGIVGGAVGQELEGDKAAQLGVFSFVDHTHSAATEQFDDAVVRNGLADHGRMAGRGRTGSGFILGEWWGFVNAGAWTGWTEDSLASLAGQPRRMSSSRSPVAQFASTIHKQPFAAPRTAP